jgi:RNA 3'-terminal phosphate cyclase (ATP)
VSRLVSLDGAAGEGGGQILRTALALSTVTGQGFEITRIRANRTRPGLRPQHVAAVRAMAMVSNARVGGVFDGSPDLRFEPGAVTAGDFRFEIGTAGSVSLVLQTVLPALALAAAPSRVAVTGGTHVPASPTYHYLAGPWASTIARLGFRQRFRLERSGFYPPGGGEVLAEVEPMQARAEPLVMEDRGALLGIRGLSGAARAKSPVAERQKQAAAERLWEERRLEASWETLALNAASPGSFLQMEALFENGCGAFGLLGEGGQRPESLGDRAARMVLRFLEGEAAVDPYLADQLAVPLAVAGCGGRIVTSAVTRHLETVAEVLTAFGVPARTWGRLAGPGGLEVDRRPAADDAAPAES